ncbi:hypothetical protein AAC387_Pa02g3023 [Persea americana]
MCGAQTLLPRLLRLSQVEKHSFLALARFCLFALLRIWKWVFNQIYDSELVSRRFRPASWTQGAGQSCSDWFSVGGGARRGGGVIGNSSGKMRLCGMRMGIKWFRASTIRRRCMHLVRLPSRARQTTSPLEYENQPLGSLSEKSCRNFADGCTCRQMTE